ncbi:S8 family serine peptidase, partial [Nonomuraea sp. NN258]|uniref:S8 family peptidase n=1 Tax=Nonomuraea antri TaxID=2730852 RepID=UPI001569F47B
MRFRPLIVCTITLALLSASAPAFADPAAAPAPAPSVTPQQAPPAPGTGTPEQPEQPEAGAPETPEAPQEPAPSPTGPEEKLEDGLALDGGQVRAIVELTDPAQNAPVASQAAAESVDVVLQPPTQSFMVVEGTAEELAKLAEDPRVTSIHRDETFTPAEVSGNLKLIGADQAHGRGMTGSGQVVAVLDTGIDTDHPAFGNRIVGQACFSAPQAGVESLCPNGQSTQTDGDAASATTPKCLAGGVNLCDHGTHVAGIAAGTGGVAPGAGIYAVQVFSRVNDEDICGEPSCLLAFESSIRQALEHVASVPQPIAAVNLSLGGQLSETACDTSEDGAVFKPLFDALLAKGIAPVVAAGNEYFDGASFPACVTSAVAVGAGDNADAIADFSNRGALVDLFAPGVDIDSSVPDNATAVHSGTSMATPHVAGALALMKAQAPQTPMTDLIEKLKTTGRPFIYQANGAEVRTPRVDLAAALLGAAPQPGVTQVPNPLPTDPGDGTDPDPGPGPDPGEDPGPGP